MRYPRWSLSMAAALVGILVAGGAPLGGLDCGFPLVAHLGNCDVANASIAPGAVVTAAIEIAAIHVTGPPGD